MQKEKRKRNRKEIRITKTFHDPDFLVKEKWKGLISMMVQVTRQTDTFNTKEKSWKKRAEVSYYICTKILSAREAAQVIRSHWSIENRNHYVRDVSMGEDVSRIRRNAGIFVRLRSFALNIMRHNGTENIANELYENSLSFEKLMKYNGLFN